MGYHSDRFKDHSVLIYFREDLVAVFPANEEGETIYSHAGLSYGGLVLLPEVKLEVVLGFFYHMVSYFHNLSFAQIRYKCFPSYLCSHPSNEDQYALHLLGAKLLKRDISSVLIKDKRTVRKSDERKFSIQSVNDPTLFWEKVLIPNLSNRFGANPVHTAEEMRILMNRFPENVRLYHITEQDVVAGAVLYVFPHAVHTQYLSASPGGKDTDALRVLISHLIDNEFAEKATFSFGTSDDGNGGINSGLLAWKERFGARSFVLDRYEIDTSRYKSLGQYE
jgi:hypothetical protein